MQRAAINSLPVPLAPYEDCGVGWTDSLQRLLQPLDFRRMNRRWEALVHPRRALGAGLAESREYTIRVPRSEV